MLDYCSVFKLYTQYLRAAKRVVKEAQKAQAAEAVILSLSFADFAMTEL